MIQSQVCSDNQPVVVGQRIRVGWWRQTLKLSSSLVVRSKFGTPTLATKKFNLNVVGGGFTLSPFMHLYPGQQVANASWANKPALLHHGCTEAQSLSGEMLENPTPARYKPVDGWL